MSKEFEHFKSVFFPKKIELEKQTEQKLQDEANEKLEQQRIISQEKIDSNLRSNKNLKILEDAGVINLFQEIIDNKIVPWANISFGKENQWIRLNFSGFCRIDIFENGKIGFLDFNMPDKNKNYYYREDERLFEVKKENNSLRFLEIYNGIETSMWPKEIEITDISDYISSKLLEPDFISEGIYANDNNEAH